MAEEWEPASAYNVSAWGHLHGRQDSLGLPLQSNNLGQREFARLLRAAKVKPITIHSLRQTYASQLLSAGAPLLYVSAQLGHTNSTITLKTYARWMPKTDAHAHSALLDTEKRVA